MTDKILTPVEYGANIDKNKRYNKYINEFAEWFNKQLTSMINAGTATIRSVELFDIPDKFIDTSKSNESGITFTSDIVDYLDKYGWAVRDFERNPDLTYQNNMIQLVAK